MTDMCFDDCHLISLKKCKHVLQLDGLRELVKGQLKRVERQVLSALIVIEVHARDVLVNLIQLNVENVNEFDWISQLRYINKSILIPLILFT